MPSPRVDSDLIRALAELLDETGLHEVEIREGERSIRVARHAEAAGAPAPVAYVAPAAPVPGEPPSHAEHPGSVKSPMVGTAYLAPSPGASPFVKVGDTVAQGQTLLIVEAMKVMNPIPAPRQGRVVQVLVGDGQPVEYDEPLLILE